LAGWPPVVQSILSDIQVLSYQLQPKYTDIVSNTRLL